MLETNEFRNNAKIMVEGQPYAITFFEHVKPGKGNQFTRVKLRNLLTGQNLERTFKSGERFEIPDMTTRDATFSYQDEVGYQFMDQASFETLIVGHDRIGDAKNYLTDNLEVTVLIYNDKPIGVDVPNAVNMKVVQTDPGFKGNTVSGATKPATFETGFSVQVPLHIKEGDILRVDTRTGLYVERVNK